MIFEGEGGTLSNVTVNDVTIDAGAIARFDGATVDGQLSGSGWLVADAMPNQSVYSLFSSSFEGGTISGDVGFVAGGFEVTDSPVTLSMDGRDLSLSGSLIGSNGVMPYDGTLTLNGDNSDFTGPVELDEARSCWATRMRWATVRASRAWLVTRHLT